MKYCERCKTGKMRQTGATCYECGDLLVEKATENCKCGCVPFRNHAFCVKCGSELKIK